MRLRCSSAVRRCLHRTSGLLFGLLGWLLISNGAACVEAGECRSCRRDSPSECLWCRETLFTWESIAKVREQAEDPDEPKAFELDRPDFVEASSTIGLGRIAIESGYTYSFNNDAGSADRFSLLP
jgi:hypothetical protein